ncbi:hypothetical protein, variant [Exophiala xenobiotica]|nr:hypothetical protein, variant [Exophiala xenobiotica]KIW60998.1 hypothetical protein, variant [Exophiala xenobiotica]
MLEIMDEALQRLYWACRAKQCLPELLQNRSNGRINTKDIVEGLGLDSSGFSDAAFSSNARPPPSVTASPSVSFTDLQQLSQGETTTSFVNAEETLQPLQDFDFDISGGDFEQFQSASTVTPPQSATPSTGMFEGQEASTYLTNSPSFQHQQNCQLHLLCRMNRLQRRAVSFHNFNTDESTRLRHTSLINQVCCEPSEIETAGLIGNAPGPFDFTSTGVDSSMCYDYAFPMPSLTVPR